MKWLRRLTSSLFFMAVHLTKDWATIGMVPIVFGAGVLLGLLAWTSGSLIFCMIGHVVMDIGLFAYWWTGIAGDFTARPISETGVDQPFVIACAAFAISLLIVLFAMMPDEEIRVRKDPALRLPRQIEHIGRLVDHILTVKDSPQLRRSLAAHFDRLDAYRGAFLKAGRVVKRGAGEDEEDEI